MGSFKLSVCISNSNACISTQRWLYSATKWRKATDVVQLRLSAKDNLGLTLVCCKMAWACASWAETTGPFWESPPYWNWEEKQKNN